jgi:hypothetical protein
MFHSHLSWWWAFSLHIFQPNFFTQLTSSMPSTRLFCVRETAHFKQKLNERKILQTTKIVSTFFFTFSSLLFELLTTHIKIDSPLNYFWEGVGSEIGDTRASRSSWHRSANDFKKSHKSCWLEMINLQHLTADYDREDYFFDIFRKFSSLLVHLHDDLNSHYFCTLC